MTTVIGIDPGNTQSAYCILEGTKIVEARKVPNYDMLFQIESWKTKPFYLAPIAIEMIQAMGMAVGREVFETCRWVGRFEECWRWCGGTAFKTIYRSEVKMHWCNSVRAKDKNIRQSLIDAYGKPRTKKNPGPTYGLAGDCWSALAVAGLHMHQIQSRPSCGEKVLP